MASDKVVRLVTEIVTEKVAEASKRMEADYKAAVAGMDRATKGQQKSIDGLGESVSGIAKHAAFAGRALSSAIGASTAAAAAADRSWISLGTSILAAFGAGGPIAGGMAIVGAGVGMLATQTTKAAAAAKASEDQFRKLLATVHAVTEAERGNLESLDREIRSLELEKFGIDISPEELAKEDTAARLRTEALANLEHAATLARLRDLRTEYERLSDARDKERGRGKSGDEFLAPMMAASRRVTRLEDDAAMPRGSSVSEIDVEIARTNALMEARKNAASAIEEEIARHERIKELTREITDATKGAVAATNDGAAAAAAWDDAVTMQAAAAKDLRDYLLDMFKEMDRQVEAQRRIDDGVESILAKYREQLALAQAVTDEERDRIAVLRDVAAAEAMGADLSQMETIFVTGMDAARATRARDAADRLAREVAREADRPAKEAGHRIGSRIADGIGDGMADNVPTIDPLLQSMQSTLGQGITDLLVDAMTNGFQNGQQIALGIVRNLLAQVLNSIVSSGLQAAFAGIFSAGGGGGGGGGFLATAFSAVTSAAGIGGGNQVGGTGGLSQIMEGIGGGGCAGGG